MNHGITEEEKHSRNDRVAYIYLKLQDYKVVSFIESLIKSLSITSAEEMGIPEDVIAMFTAAEVTAKCMADYVNSNVLTDDEKFYMKRFVT